MERFSIPAPEQLSPEQVKFVQGLLAGPRGGGEAGPEATRRMLERGPFGAWLRSPELGDRLQRVGEYIRFGSSLPARLSELAILITARHWTAQYEWYAHRPLALKAGLDPAVAADLAENRRPARMKDDEAAVYDFCIELHRTKHVTDTTFRRAVTVLGDKGVVDLVGVCGYYTAVSMTLNVANVPLPPGEPLPLKLVE